jgi:hypothetical protein
MAATRGPPPSRTFCHATPKRSPERSLRTRGVASSLLQEFRQSGIVVLHPRRRTALKRELTIWIGVQKEIARVVDDVDAAPLARGGANAIEYRPQVEIGDHNSEPAAIRCNQRRGDPYAMRR